MRRLQTAGVVLLFVSLLTNAVLILRAPGRSSSDRPSVPGPQEQTRALSQLASERERNAVLSARIRELETTLETARRAGPAASPRDEKASLFRDRLRRYIRVVGDGMSYVDPEMTLTISEASMEYFRASVHRAKDPATYAEALKAVFDAVLQDEMLKLDGEQPKELRRILEDYRDALLRVPPDSVAERNFHDLEIEGSAMSRARTLLEAEQYRRLRSTLGGLGLLVQGCSTYSMASDSAEQHIVFSWEDCYGLDETQKSAAQAAARALAETLRQIEVQYRGQPEDTMGGSERRYDARIRGQRAQLAALKVLENIMTPVQKERLHARLLMEFYLQPPPVEEK